MKVLKEVYEWSVPWTGLHSSSSSSTTFPPKVEDEEVFQWTLVSPSVKEQGESQTQSSSPSLGDPDWKLVNRAMKEVHAVFVEKWGATERGELQFRRSFGARWEVGLLGCLGVVVEGERRKRRRGGFTKGFLSGFAGVK